MNAESIINLTNQQRTSAKLNELKQNNLLKIAADKKTTEMINQNYFDHYSPTNKTIADFTPTEYKYFALGENLAFGYNTKEELVTAWMKSPTHKDNILYQKYKDNAISVAPIADTYLVTHVFGTQQSQYLAEVKGIREYSVATSTKRVESVFNISAIFFVLIGLVLVIQKIQRLKKTKKS